MSSTHLEPSVTLLRAIWAVVSVVVSLVVSIPITVISSLTRSRERVRHLCWCTSRRGNLRGSSGGDFPGRFAGADLDKVVLARSGCYQSESIGAKSTKSEEAVGGVRNDEEASCLLVVPLRNPSMAAKSVPSPNVSHKVARSAAKRWKGASGSCGEERAQAVDAQAGKGEAGEVCKGLVKTHHPGGRLGGAKLGPASGVVGSAMLVTFPDVSTDCAVAVRVRGRECKSSR